MKKYLIILLISFVFSFNADLSIAFKAEALKNLEFAFENLIREKINRIEVPDYEAINKALLKFKFTETTISISNYSHDTLHLDLSKDNCIKFSVRNLNGIMHTAVDSKFIFNSRGNLTVDLKNINVTAELQFFHEPEFSFKIEHLKIAYKQTITTKDSTFLAFLKANVDMWDKMLHKYIETEISETLKSTITKTLFETLDGKRLETVEDVQLSIFAEPLVKHGFFVLPMNVTYFQHDRMLTKWFSEKINNFVHDDGESVQVRVNFTQIQHFLAFLHRFGHIKFQVSHWDIKQIGLMMTTSQMAVFFKGLNVYHKDNLPIGLEFASVEDPMIVIQEEKLELDLRVRMDIFVYGTDAAGPESTKTFFNAFFTNIKAKLHFSIDKDFDFHLEVDDISFHQTVDGSTHAQLEEALDFECFLNFLSGAIRPIVNNILNNLKVKRLSIFGISFEALESILNRNNLEFQLTPILDKEVRDWISQPILFEMSGLDII